MTTSNITRVVLKADEGKILTNGTTYGKEIILGIADNAEDYREIAVAEYEAEQAQEAVTEA